MKFVRRVLRAILYRIRAEYTTEKLVHLGLKVGKNFTRLHGVILDPSHCWLITIGDNVTMAPRVHILAHDASTFHFLGYTKIGRVDIGNNVFIGSDTVVLPNVRIGDNVVIGSNSTVSRDVPSNCVVAGNPARYLCTIDAFVEKNRSLMVERPRYGPEYTLREGVDDSRKTQMQQELSGGPGFVV
jgi:maltose O-acetyltransferase